MSPTTESHLEREVRLLRGSVVDLTTKLTTYIDAGSTLRNEHGRLDERVRHLERDQAELAVARNRKPPLLPWRLFFAAFAAAVLAVAGAHFVN